MHDSESQSAVPDDWFVDPVQLGVPGVRRSTPQDDSVRGSGIVPDATLAWQTDSLCAQTDPEAFFPEKGGSTRDAKKICTSCEVRAQCLDYALANDERFGIWGGLSERERRKLRKRA
ncbi:WhiB family transcriptional regulator [Cryobacterium frigoriphilum]|uniref:Transcriptional regulator WhiB n=1 Tax=Cryobacterium frigoriphilum TaxID=1259150 RepID=A0A4R9A2D1_9MICO|nr:WhiB family transcriptional regulator [Cryobacterium frigoriphilum]TFD50816.1 WhiB family transcriptional regulator [Cryobacterium frigoriphilum]